MRWQLTPLLFPLLVSAVVCALLAALAWRHRIVPAARGFVLLMAASAWWSFFYALYRASADLTGKLALALAVQAGAIVVPLAWTVFVLQYTRRERWLAPRALALLSAVPALTLALALTNPLHHQFWSRFALVVRGGKVAVDSVGAWGFWLHVGYSWALLSLAVFLLLLRVLRSAHIYRGQAAAALFAVLVPWVGNVLHLSGVVRFPANPMPLLFTVAGAAFAWAIFRFRFLDILPVAREALVEQMRDAVVVLAEDGRVLDLNAAARALFRTTPERAVGRPAESVLPALAAVLPREGSARPVQEEVELGPEGGVHEARTTPLLHPGGALTGWLLVLRDVTERRRMDGERAEILERERDARAQAEAAVRARDDVLGIVSHDLRNPLAAVILHASSLLETEDQAPLPGWARDHARWMLRSAEQMERLILDLLEVARIEAGQLSVSPAPHDAGALVRESVQMLAPLAEERGIALRAVEPAGEARVRADAARVQQVVGNLVGNALAFTPRGGAVTLGAEPEGEWTRFWVRDTGRGIPAEHLPRIFDRFWQARHTRRGGAGLGLAIARGIVEAHGGSIRVESVVGEGTTVHFTLPAERE